MLRYSVKLEAQQEGGFTATVPALPGCVSEGETVGGALENIKDAIEGYLTVLAKHKRPIPIEVAESETVEVFGRRSPRRRATIRV